MFKLVTVMKFTFGAASPPERQQSSGYLRVLPISDGCLAVKIFFPVSSKKLT